MATVMRQKIYYKNTVKPETVMLLKTYDLTGYTERDRITQNVTLR